MSGDFDDQIDESPETMLMAMVKHIDAMNNLSKSLEDREKIKEIEKQGKQFKEEHLPDAPYYWRGADIQIVYCESGTGTTEWQASTTQVGWGHEEPCPTTYPVFLAGLINRIQDGAGSYLDSMNKYFWYGRIAETAQNIASRSATVTKKEFAREIIFQQIAATNELRNMLLEHINKKSGTKNLYEQGWRLYFAFGKNVNQRDMLSSDRAPNARFLMADFIDNYKFIIDKRGVASIVKSPGSRVWGVLWSVSPEDIARLDLREGVSQGVYRKEKINTAMWTGSAAAIGGYEDEQTQALVYISNSPEGTMARENYIEGIIQGLRDALVDEDEFSHYEKYIPLSSKDKRPPQRTLQKKTTPVSPEPKYRPDNGFMPADISLPFFAYGIFKEGEFGFDRLANLKRFVENAIFRSGILLERDGLPLLMDCSNPDNSAAIDSLGSMPSPSVRGDIIFFNEQKSAEAYLSISELEPKKHYKWAVVEIEQTDMAGKTCRANTLVARRPQIGTNVIWADCWSVKDDLFYLDVIDLCERQISAGNKPIEKQAALLMAWSAIERICAIKYSLKIGPREKVKKLGSDDAFKSALKSFEAKFGQDHPFRPIQDTRDTESDNSYAFLFSDPDGSALYLYHIRNNISHRGKGGYDLDIPIIDASLEILILTIQNLLNIENYYNHQSQ